MLGELSCSIAPSDAIWIFQARGLRSDVVPAAFTDIEEAMRGKLTATKDTKRAFALPLSYLPVIGRAGLEPATKRSM